MDDLRAVGLVIVYVGLLGAMYFIEECRNVPMYLAALYLSFVNTLVLHSSLHKGPFGARWLNRAWQLVLSLGSLYPSSANAPAHNIVHHQLRFGRQPDWVDTGHTRFRYGLWNLIHFPNVVGPNTFFGVARWARRQRNAGFSQWFTVEQGVAFGITFVAMCFDFWGALFFIVFPQLWGARGVLRLNHLQHEGCDLSSRYNHSRNFTGKLLNWFWCNDGFHTVHHNKAGLHWSKLPERHAADVAAHVDPRLNEKSLLAYLFRRYILNRPTVLKDRD